MRCCLSITVCCALPGLFLLPGCASYTTPGGAVSMASLVGTDTDIAERMRRQPAAQFPARIMVAHVQAPQYRSEGAHGHGIGNYSVVTTREVEREEDFDRIRTLPGVAAVAVVNRIILPAELRTDRELCLAAASLKADMLFVYTFDTTFRIDEHDVGPLQLISLGMLPTREAQVLATASMALIDVRSGYVYGLAEGNARRSQLASAWNSSEAVDSARLRAERKAFEQMLDEFEKTWQGVVVEYAPATEATQDPADAP